MYNTHTFDPSLVHFMVQQQQQQQLQPKTEEQIAQEILQRYGTSANWAPTMSGGFEEDEDDEEAVDDFTGINLAASHHTTPNNNNNQCFGAVSINSTPQQTPENNRVRVNLPNRSELNHCLSRIRLFCLNHYGKFENDLKLLNELEVKINRNINH